jgi:hypothetical protein
MIASFTPAVLARAILSPSRYLRQVSCSQPRQTGRRSYRLHSEDKKTPGKVTVDVGEKELEQLKPVGVEELPQEGALDEVERKIPTAEGIREMEASKRTEAQSRGREAAESLKTQQQAKPTSFWESQPWCWLRLLYCFSMGWQLDKEVRHVRARDSCVRRRGQRPVGGRNDDL